jgi:uncharacterized protein (TIGR00369 family)
MDELLQLGKQAVAAQPFSVLIGAELTGLSPGQAELRVPITPQLKQQHGFVHGGVTSYAADNVLTAAGASVLGPAIVTAEYKINYLRPVVGTALIARATVVHSSRSQAVCRCDVFMVDGDRETLCAVAQGTIARIGQSAESQA